MSSGGNFQDFFTRPDRWLREHRDEAKIAALVAAAVAAPYAAGAFGAAGAGAGIAAEGGLTAAELGAGGAASGLGLTAADYAAMGAGTGALSASEYAALSGMETGASAGQAALVNAAPDYAAISGLETGASAGQAGLLNPMSIGSAPTDPLAAWGGVDPHAMETGVPDFNTFGAQADLNMAKLQGYLRGDGVYKGLKALNSANQFAKLAQPQPVAHTTVQRPSMYQGGGQELAAMQALLSNPASAERLKYLLRARGISV